jgi:hypothetical protein
MPGPEPLSADEHKRRGTYQRCRHEGDVTEREDAYDRNGDRIDPARVVSDADRTRVLRGLPATAKRIADGLLELYWDFDVAALGTLRSYALSCDRLARLEDAKRPDVAAIHAETEINLALLAALKLG